MVFGRTTAAVTIPVRLQDVGLFFLLLKFFPAFLKIPCCYVTFKSHGGDVREYLRSVNSLPPERIVGESRGVVPREFCGEEILHARFLHYLLDCGVEAERIR